jgi:hypothetical protein
MQRKGSPGGGRSVSRATMQKCACGVHLLAAAAEPVGFVERALCVPNSVIRASNPSGCIATLRARRLIYETAAGYTVWTANEDLKRLKLGTTSKSDDVMANTRNFSETVKTDLEMSAEFRGALLSEAVTCMISGDVETGKIVLREYVNGTVGFLKLGTALGRSPKSLMRMLGPQGNPQARNLFEMVAYLQKVEGTVLQIHAKHSTAI